MADQPRQLDLTSHSPGQTRRLGQRLGELLGPGDVVLLEGEFGAGKTVFAQGVAAGLGVAEYVTSPSFTMVNEHRGRGGLPLYHVDLYRVESAQEAVDLGLLDIMGGEGVCLIEWAERARELAGDDYLQVQFTGAGVNRRRLRFSAVGRRSTALLARYAAAVVGP
mgnify:CR=1 FL=1